MSRDSGVCLLNNGYVKRSCKEFDLFSFFSYFVRLVWLRVFFYIGK